MTQLQFYFRFFKLRLIYTVLGEIPFKELHTSRKKNLKECRKIVLRVDVEPYGCIGSFSLWLVLVGLGKY